MRYCIGDIHGCYYTFNKLICQICVLDKNPELYFVGDLIDRGSNSKAVIDLIINLKNKGLKINSVRGNHEEMLLYSYENSFKVTDTNWNSNGAPNTIRSLNPIADLNLPTKELIPEKYYTFLHSLPYFIALNDYIIVHAGFNFNSKDPFSDTKTMLWTRKEENKFKFTKEKIIIHGHTPISFKQIKSNINNKITDIINIDSGCIFTNRKNLGTLTAFNLHTQELINIKNIDFKL
ncbi:MAG: hypothetical protein GQ564_19350 [Bacteroidales bacterium]|nr:hypothetical protein [Bacteroidales bacterium]